MVLTLQPCLIILSINLYTYNLGNLQQQFTITLCFIGVTQSSDGLQYLLYALNQ